MSWSTGSVINSPSMIGKIIGVRLTSQAASSYWPQSIPLPHNGRMAPPRDDEARAYLAEFLATAGIDMKAASLAIGRNHAYLQQYIKSGKPLWLRENDREGLARLYGVDPERLKPPASGLPAIAGHRYDQGQVNVPDHSKLIDEPSPVDLLLLWERIPPDRRRLAWNILQNLTEPNATTASAIG